MSLHEVAYAQLGGFYSLNPGIEDGSSLNNGLEYKRPVGQSHLVQRDQKGQQVQDIEADPKKDPLVKPKGKKKLMVLIALLVLVAAGGGWAWFYFDRIKGEDKEVETEESKLSKAPKLYFPLDPVVINLSDLGGDRFAQVGITFQIRDEKSAEAIKKMLPTLRSAILITLSQKSSDELLSKPGKEKLSLDILAEVGSVFGVKPDEPKTEESKPDKVEKSPPKNQAMNPVLEVLFSSLIVQ
jgi:flagellar FliL protein